MACRVGPSAPLQDAHGLIIIIIIILIAENIYRMLSMYHEINALILLCFTGEQTKGQRVLVAAKQVNR